MILASRDGWSEGQALYPLLKAGIRCAVLWYMQGTTLIHLYNKEHGILYDARLSRADHLLAKFAGIFAVIGIILVSTYLIPWVSFWVNSASAQYDATSQAISETAKTAKDYPLATIVNKNDGYQPRYDPKLPVVNRIKITAIGVNSDIQEASYKNIETALKNGVWRAPDAGTPFDRSVPTIVAAHRFGYLAWSNLFRRTNSFYNLPKLKVGDTIEIDWQQRKYIYEVFAESQGDKIGNIPADLILYTCETLNGPVRIVKYARLLEI